MTTQDIITNIGVYGPIIVTAASGAANAINFAHPTWKDNPAFGTISKVIDFLALNWVQKKS